MKMNILYTSRHRFNALKILCLLCVIGFVAGKDPSALGYVKQLFGWNQGEKTVEDEKEPIPEWSVYGGKKEEVKSDFGVDDYSTGETVDTTSYGHDSEADDFRPPPPKDAPPPLPDEVEVDDDGSSIMSDITVDEDAEFHDAQAMADEDEFHDAVQDEL